MGSDMCIRDSPDTHPFLLNRCFAFDPNTISRAARAVIDGQGAGGVLSVIKHIPGHGLAKVDSHFELPTVGLSHDELSRTDFATFKAVADAPFAMTGHIVFSDIDPENPATTSPTMIRLIREEMAFGGLLISDDISMKALSGDLGSLSAASRKAGCDVVLHCNGLMDELEKVVANSGTFSDIEAIRAQAALDQRQTTDEVDIPALRAELEGLERAGLNV